MLICVLLSVAFNLNMKCACLRLFEKDPTIIIMNCALRSKSSTALEKQRFIKQTVSVCFSFQRASGTQKERKWKSTDASRIDIESKTENYRAIISIISLEHIILERERENC